MVLQGIRSSSSAILSIAKKQDVSANNLSNALSNGFKASRATQESRSDGGTSIGEISQDFGQGGIVSSGGPLDLAIEGDGFFQVQTSDGVRFSRSGTFSLDQNRRVVTPDGNPLQPEITIPEEAESFHVGRNGAVSIRTPEGDREQVGQIELARFPNPDGLQQEGGGLFRIGANSGNPIEGIPGQNTFGELKSGVLERSNTNLTREITNQIVNENLFSLNVEALKRQDDMLGEIIDLNG